MQFSCRQSVSLFMVAGAEPEHGVPGGRQQRAGVVDAEVAARVAEDDGGLPRRATRRVHSGPRTSAPSGLTRRIDSRGMSTPGSSSASGQ